MPQAPLPAAGKRRRTGLIVLAGAAVLVVVAGAVAVVRLTGRDDKASPTAATASFVAPPEESGDAGAPGGVAPGAGVDGQAGGASRGPSQSASAAGGPVGADEFAGTALDTGKWAVYKSTAPNGSLTTASNVTVAGGELRVAGIGKDATGKGNTTGGLCWCSGGGNRTYGSWKVRARFDAGLGYAPVIGLWPQSDKGSVDGWMNLARFPEADRKTAHAAVNWNATGVHAYDRTLKGDFTAWHTYTVEWRATSVTMYVDDQLFFDSAASTTPVVIPKVPMHLYLQLTAGPSGDVAAPGAATPERVVMHVDWVRLYA